LTTELSAWQIVAGKFAARLVFVGALLLTGRPVVTLVILFGGVDPGALLAGYAIALATACRLGARTLVVSLLTETRRSSVVRAYVWGVGLTWFGFCCSCFHFPAYLSPVGATFVVLSGWAGFMGPPSPADVGTFVGVYALVHLLIASALLMETAGRLRSVAAERTGSRAPVAAPGAVEANPFVVVTPAVDVADPLGWKERYFGGKNPLAGSHELFLAAMLLTPLLIYGLTASYIVGERGPVAAFATLAGSLALLVAGVRATGSVVGERQNGTLDSLLM